MLMYEAIIYPQITSMYCLMSYKKYRSRRVLRPLYIPASACIVAHIYANACTLFMIHDQECLLRYVLFHGMEHCPTSCLRYVVLGMRGVRGRGMIGSTIVRIKWPYTRSTNKDIMSKVPSSNLWVTGKFLTDAAIYSMETYVPRYITFMEMLEQRKYNKYFF